MHEVGYVFTIYHDMKHSRMGYVYNLHKRMQSYYWMLLGNYEIDIWNSLCLFFSVFVFCVKDNLILFTQKRNAEGLCRIIMRYFWSFWGLYLSLIISERLFLFIKATSFKLPFYCTVQALNVNLNLLNYLPLII